MMRLLITLLLFVAVEVHAQTIKDYQKKWELAKGHYADGNYDMALILFQNLSSENSLNPYVEYANYYSALCYFHLNKPKNAREYLLQLTNKYPMWEHKEDALYLLANTQFVLEQYEKGVEILQGNTIKDCANLKMHYLQQAPYTTVETIWKRFPTDREVATVYCYKRATNTLLLQKDRRELDSLIRLHNIKSNELQHFVKNAGQKFRKDTFHVALIYPFLIPELKQFHPGYKNRFVIDHYWGMQLAEDSLRKEGNAVIRYHLYDNANDSVKIKKILALDEMKKMDAIVGSIYRKNMSFISDYCNKNRIICINPLANHSTTILDSGYTYMYNPAYEAIGTSAAAFVIDSLKSKKIMVLCYKEDKDTTIARAFITRLKEANIKVTKKLYLDKNTDVLSALSKVKNEEVDLIFAPSENTSIGTNITSWMVIREITIPIIGNAAWLESREYNIVNINNRSAFFYDENYVDVAADSSIGFYRMYVNRYQTPPMVSSYKGAELALFLSHHFTQYGQYFNQSLWNMQPYKGVFYPQFNYHHSYYNTFVPMYGLQDFELLPANYDNGAPKKPVVETKKPK